MTGLNGHFVGASTPKMVLLVAPWRTLYDAAGAAKTLEMSEVSRDIRWSGRRESNPRSQLGKLMFCR